MKIISVNIILISLLGFISCAQKNNKLDEDTEQMANKEIYANEFGEIELIKLTDSTVQTIFRNNENDRFDTIMEILPSFTLTGASDSMPFYSLDMRGIQQHNGYLNVYEFSSLLYLDQFIRIEQLYDRPFFRIGTEVRIEGDVVRAKGTTVNGIWIAKDDPDFNLDYAIVRGVLHKEKYPESFYSSDESPQGLYSKNDKVHFRLVLENAVFESPVAQLYKGSKVELSDGQPAIAWEFADSEAYILEGHEPWTKEEIGEEISVNGYLVQNNKGSFLKNWKIEDGH